jgi:hypothetical protein
LDFSSFFLKINKLKRKQHGQISEGISLYWFMIDNILFSIFKNGIEEVKKKEKEREKKLMRKKRREKRN